jgi:hypothetical protein
MSFDTGGEKSSKATKRSRTNTHTHEDMNSDLAGLLKPVDDDDTEDMVSILFSFFKLLPHNLAGFDLTTHTYASKEVAASGCCRFLCLLFWYKSF